MVIWIRGWSSKISWLAFWRRFWELTHNRAVDKALCYLANCAWPSSWNCRLKLALSCSLVVETVISWSLLWIVKILYAWRPLTLSVSHWLLLIVLSILKLLLMLLMMSVSWIMWLIFFLCWRGSSSQSSSIRISLTFVSCWCTIVLRWLMQDLSFFLEMTVIIILLLSKLSLMILDLVLHLRFNILVLFRNDLFISI
jgi:hypothetical protein